MFLSNCWLVVTSPETTNACTGCCSCSPIASANWFVSLAPTTLNEGGCGNDATGGAPPPVDGGVLPPIVGIFVFVIGNLSKTH